MKTTTIGAYPKPGYLDLPDWFRKGTGTAHPTTGFLEAVEALGEEAEALFRRAARDVIRDQEAAGIDIATAGWPPAPRTVGPTPLPWPRSSESPAKSSCVVVRALLPGASGSSIDEGAGPF